MPPEPNYRRLAVALEYDPLRAEAPKVAASGRGDLAEQIIRVAQASGVPIREDRDLVELLGQLEVGDLIPSELYVVVAEVLAYLYRMNLRTTEAPAAPAAPERPQAERVSARPVVPDQPLERTRSTRASAGFRPAKKDR